MYLIRSGAWIQAPQRGDTFVCQPAQRQRLSKLQPSDSSSTCCFLHPHHFPFLADLPTAILCNFVVSSMGEILRWLWFERAGQSHGLPQIGARCHQGSRSVGEHCLSCMCACEGVSRLLYYSRGDFRFVCVRVCVCWLMGFRSWMMSTALTWILIHKTCASTLKSVLDVRPLLRL